MGADICAQLVGGSSCKAYVRGAKCTVTLACVYYHRRSPSCAVLFAPVPDPGCRQLLCKRRARLQGRSEGHAAFSADAAPAIVAIGCFCSRALSLDHKKAGSLRQSSSTPEV